MNASEKGQNAVKGNRIHFLDNLRTFMIFLVVLYHAGGVYEATGMWGVFWIVDDPATNNISGLLGLIPAKLPSRPPVLRFLLDLPFPQR